MLINKLKINKLAKLAYLTISNKEILYYYIVLNKMISMFDLIKSANIDNIVTMTSTNHNNNAVIDIHQSSQKITLKKDKYCNNKLYVIPKIY